MSPRARRNLLLVTALLAAPTARADSPSPAASSSTAAPRLVTVRADPGLSHALDVALASWHVRLVPVDGPVPDADLDEAIRTAHRLARESGAQAVLWLRRGPTHGGEWSLWMYDERAHQVTVRPLDGAPPFDDAAAASVALTVKTLLRPVLETRAPPEPPAGSDETAAPATPRTPPPGRHTARVESYVAARVPTDATDPAAVRFGVEGTWFPSWFRQYLGLSLSVDGGPSVLVDRPGIFSGTFTDVTLGLSVRGRLHLRRWMSVELGLGPGLHVTTIEGSSPSGDLSGRVSRVDPSLDALLGVEFGWGPLRVGPVVGLTFLMRYQHYTVGPQSVLDVPPTQVQGGLRLGVELP